MKTMLKSLICAAFALCLCLGQAGAQDAFAPLVSVMFTGGNLGGGTVTSAQVSVSAPGIKSIDGTFISNPVSVSYPTVGLSDGAVTSPSVSVAYTASTGIDSGSVTSGPASVVLNQFLGLWSMDGNWQDSSSNANHGTAYGSPGFDPQGKASIAGSFNGTSAYLDMGSSTALRPFYSVSIEAWIKPNIGSAAMFIAGNTDEATSTGYALVIGTDGRLQMKIGNGAWATVTDSAPLASGLWNHVAGTYDGKKVVLYVNGQQVGETEASGIITYKNSFRVGYRPGSTGAGYYSGLMDELAVFNRPLAAAEVLSHYRAGKLDITPPADPVVNPVASPTASASITLSGTKEADSSIWINGIRTVAIDALTTWQCAYTLKSGINTLNISAVDSADNQSGVVSVSIILDDKPPYMVSSIPMDKSETSRVVGSVTINLADEYSAIDLTATLATAAVTNASGQTIGGQWTQSGPGSVVFAPSAPFAQDTYTVAIRPTDVVGNSGTLQITFTNHDTTPPVTTVSLVGAKGGDGWYTTPVTATLTATDGLEGSGVATTQYSYDQSAWTTYVSPLVFEDDGARTLYYRSVDLAGNTEATRSVSVKINKSGLVGMWHMDGDWKDASIMNRDAAATGAIFSSDSKTGASAGIFDGTNDYVDMGNWFDYQSFSIEMWVKADAAQGTYADIIDNNHVSGINWVLQQNGSSTNNYLWGIADGSANIAVGLTPGVWTYLVITREGATRKNAVYVDGNLLQATTGVADVNYNSSHYFRLARWGGGGRYWHGLMDELAIYNRALTPEEIKAHHDAAFLASPTVDPVTSPTASQAIALSGSKLPDTAILVNGTQVVAMDASTTWGSVYTLQPGSNVVSVTAADAAGHHSQPVTVTIIYDNEAPAITGSIPANNSSIKTVVSSISLVLADAYSGVDLAATMSGASVKDATGQIVAGGWSSSGTDTVVFAPAGSLATGTYTVTIYPTDTLGNRLAAGIAFTYDTTAPPAPGINAVTTPTRLSSQVISGTRTQDSVAIIVTSAAATVGQVSYPTSTTWNVTISGLQQGTNTITAYATDSAGNQSDGASVTIVYDITAPSAPAVDAFSSPTKSSSITLSGSKEAGSYLYVNNIKTAVPLADATWSYTVNLSVEGKNTIVLFAKDEAGNQGPSTSVDVVRDTTAPKIAASAPSSGAFISQPGGVVVTLADDYSSVDLNASLAGANLKTSTGALVSGAWSSANGQIVFAPSTTLPDGTYTVTLFPADSLGNKGAASFSFTIDTTAPTVQSLSMSPSSPIKAGTVAFTIVFNESMSADVQPTLSFGKASPFGDYIVSTGSWIDAKTWRGSFLFTTSTGDGTYTVRVTGAKDKAQNIMMLKDAGTFVLVTVAPGTPSVNTVTTPTKTPNQTLSGTKPAGMGIAINGIQRVSPDATTLWSYLYPLSEGQNSLSITARDAAGNDSFPVPVSITLDTTPPLFTIDNYKSPASSATQTLSGRKEPGCVVKLNNVTIFDANDQSSTWSYTVTLTAGITNRFAFSAADALSNTTNKTLDIVYDISAPAALGPGMLVADGKGKGTEVTLSWTAYVESSDIAYYRVYVSPANFSDTAGMTTVATTNKGMRSYKVTGLTQGSTYYFGVVPCDTSGNFDSSVNTAAGVPTDTVAPEDVVITSVSAGYDAANGNYITLKWTPSANSSGDLADQIVHFDGGTGYDAGTSIGKTATMYTKSGLADATKYKFKVSVKDTSDHESAGVLAEGVTRLDNPAGLSAKPGNARVALSWSPLNSSYLKQYKIYRTVSDTPVSDVSAMVLVGTLAPNVITYTDAGVANGATYQYAVTALNTYDAEKTAVSSVAAKPRMDETGPAITAFNITPGQIITAPLTISASASDAESAMDRIELYIDGAQVKSQPGGNLSYYWNAIAATDGGHAVKLVAYDQFQNSTEDQRQVIISLAPPAVPSITGHTVAQIQPNYLVNVAGAAALGSTVSLRVNGVIVSQAPVSDSGAFSFASVRLIEGDNVLSAKASHRGGESAYSPDYKITVDTGPPPTPVNLGAQVLSGGPVRFTWASGTGELPFGYNLYVSGSAFTDKAAPGVTKANTSLIKYTLYEYTPPDDGKRYYAVTSLDSAGNESGLSNVVSASSDRAMPSILSIEYIYDDGTGSARRVTPPDPVGRGGVKVSLAVSEALKEIPFFSLEPAEGTPIVVSMQKVDDTHYEGGFTVTTVSPNGPTTYKFSGKDMTGNRGNAQGAGISIDVRGPEASVLSPISVLQTTAGPAQVEIVMDEPAVAAPVMDLKASNGMTARLANLVSSDEGIHWVGTVDPSGLPDGQAEFVLDDAKDKFGNIGRTVSSGRYILLYKDSVPPPGVPQGLTATSAKGGAVTLTWYPVEGATSYNIYRRADGETASARILSAIAGPPVQDTPPADGMYYYSASSIGLLEAESQRSAEVQGVSDRTGPSAPLNLALKLGGSGVTATWDAVTGEALKGYNLYRSDAPIVSTIGLTPVAKVANPLAIDTAPTQSKRFYAVASVDLLGNEGPPSESKEIVFPVSPVRNVVLQRIDDAAPVLTWQAPAEGSIAGYHLYRNGSLITQAPIIDLAYTDGYYSGGSVTYGISAVNDLGDESPVLEVTLFDVSMEVASGTTFRRGLLETARLSISSGQSLTVDALDVEVGTAAPSTIEGPFSLTGNSSYQIEKVLATTADAPSTVAVLMTARWSPVAGATVKITKTQAVDVRASGSAFEIYNDPLIRGTEAKVRVKVNNIGSAQMEFLTSEGAGATRKLAVHLKDEDGNVLATGYLNQRVGNAIVNVGAYSVARLNPGDNILTEPVTFGVPMSAPYKVLIEAAIESTYYHYGKADQVTAPGMMQSTGTTISETAYRAEAAAEHTFYPSGQPVLITGRAISNEPSTNGQIVPMPFVPVKIGISVRGFDRFATVTTDASGNFSYTFTPGANEAGVYNVWAIHPDVSDRTVQSTFAIAGLAIDPGTATVRMARGKTLELPVTITNYGGTSLNGLTFSLQNSAGIAAEVVNTGDDILTAGEKAGITLRLTSASDAPDTGFATLIGTTAEGLSVRLDASITMVKLMPVISTTPSFIDTGMVKGNQKIQSFDIKNVGEDTLRGARIEGPSTPWMSLAVERNLGDIPSDASKTVAVMFSPSETVSQGVYDDKLVIYSDNHIPYTYHMQVTVTSDAVGSVYFDVMDELMEKVPTASITFQNQLLPELLYTMKTGPDGTAMQNDIPEGRYSFNISATGHKSYSGSFVITAGLTATVPIALEVTLVQVEWSVTPVIIEDRYEITLSTTFETQVPTPVLVVEPAGLTIPELRPGQVFNGEFTVANYGLIGLNEVNLHFPTSFLEYDIELLGALPATLNAMQKITMPYKITRREQTTAGNLAFPSVTDTAEAQRRALLEDVKGYGGSSTCYTSFNVTIDGTAVICPGTFGERKVTKSADYTVILPIPGSDCSISGGGGAGGGVPIPVGGGASVPCINCRPTPTQPGSGGWLPGGTPTVIEGDSCGGEPPVCPGIDCPRVCSCSVVHLNNGMYEDGNTDMEVKVNGIPLSFERKYVSRWVPVGTPLGDPCRPMAIASAGGSGGGGGGGSRALGFRQTIDKAMCGTDSGIQPQQAHGWTSPLFGMVRELDGGIAYFNGEGHAIFFARDQVTGVLKPTEGGERYAAERGITVLPAAGGVKIKDKSGLTRTFAGMGVYRLISMENESGTRLTFNYEPQGEYGICIQAGGANCGDRDYSKDRLTSITDDSGMAAMSFRYDVNGYISEITDREGRTARYQADASGRLLRVEGIEGEVSTYEYATRNNAHLLTRKLDPVGNEVNIEYKVGGLEVTKVTADGGAFVQQFSYDFPNRVARYTDPNGATFKYDISKEGGLAGISLNDSTLKKIEQYENGRLHVITDESGNKRMIRYNERFDPISITDGEGNIITIQYNQFWKISKVVDPMGNVTTYGYDQLGRLISVTYPDGEVVALETDASGNVTKATRGTGADAVSYTFQYDGRGNVIRVTDSLGNATVYTYDQYNHVSSFTDPANNTYKVTTDRRGRPLTIEDPLGHRWTLTYDKKGNMTSARDELNRTTSFAYDYKGRITSITDAANNKTEYVYDSKGNLREVREASGTTEQKSTRATYDTSDRITSITDPLGNVTRYEYAGAVACPTCSGGSAEIPMKITDPLGNVTLLSFDRNGKVVGVRDRNNKVVSATYDKAGRITKITYPDNTSESYSYDPRGRLLTASNAETTLTFTYNDFGKVWTYTDSRLNKSISYEYDKRGNRTKMTDGEGGVTTYAYDNRNLLTSITNPGGKVFTFNYDEAGRRTGLNYPNGIATTYTYDPAGQIVDIVSSLNSVPVSHNAYTYDPAGNRLTNTDLNGTHTYQYDSTYQLIQAANSNLTEAFAYDKNGNRITETRGAEAVNYTHSAGNRIVTRGTVTYTHDGNGNIIRKTQGISATTYEYDYAGRLKKVTMPDGTMADYKYDAIWRRIEKTVSKGATSTVVRYLYDGLDLLAEYDETNTVKTTYLHNIGIDDPLLMQRGGQAYCYHKDGLGSISALTDASGNTVQKYDYDIFGKIMYIKDPAFVQPFTFTGREYDPETGLYDYRFRYYDPEIGRFISEDPIGLFAGDYNLYRYVWNDPQNWIDPWGLFEHHVIPRAIWVDLNLSKEVKKIFRDAVIEAGDHNFRDPHSEYNKLVKELWDDFFRGSKPENITKCEAKLFLERVTYHPKANKLLREILINGGAKVPRWIKVRKINPWKKVIPIIGTILMVHDELFGDIGEAY